MKAIPTLLLMMSVSSSGWLEEVACPQGTFSEKEKEGSRLAVFCQKWVESGGVLSAPTREKVSHGPIKIFEEVPVRIGTKFKLLTSGEYKDGTAVGTWIEHYDDGSTMAKYEVNTKGEPHGAFTKFHPGGAKRAEGRFENNNPVGTWKFWDDSGKLTKEGSYEEIQKVAQEFDAQQEKKQQLAQTEQTKADAKAIEADYKQNGYPLTDSVFTPCNRAQIESLQSGDTMSTRWIPKKGQKFRADDNYYRVAAVISKSPIQLLIEGSTNVSEAGLKNSCLIVLTIKNRSQLKTTTAPHPGYEIKVGDSITGFKVRSIGTTSVRMQTIRSISSVAADLPNFELTSSIAVAND